MIEIGCRVAIAYQAFAWMALRELLELAGLFTVANIGGRQCAL